MPYKQLISLHLCLFITSLLITFVALPSPDTMKCRVGERERFLHPGTQHRNLIIAPINYFRTSAFHAHVNLYESLNILTCTTIQLSLSLTSNTESDCACVITI